MVGVLAVKAAPFEMILPLGIVQSIEAIWDSLRLTFAFESLGLCVFGLSWRIKGRFLYAFEDAAALPQPRAA